MKIKRLDALPIGESARVTSLENTGGMRRRLLDLGFTGGANTQCLYESPTGNPRAYAIRGAVIALRNDDAHAVRVEGDEKA